MINLEWLYIINALLIVYMPYALYHYYKYFHVYPIKMWNSPLMLTCGIAIFIHQIFVLMAQLIPTMITWMAAVPLVVTDSILTDSFILQAFILYIKFEIVNAQEQCNTQDQTKLAELERLLRRARLFVSRKFCVLFMGFNLAFILLASCGFIALHPEVGMVPASQCRDGNHPNCERLVEICMLKTAFSWSLAVIMAFKLKMVFDSIGIKQSLKKISVIFLLTNLIYLSLLSMVPVVGGYAFSTSFILFGYHIIFHYGIARQVRMANEALSNSAENQSLIHQFLLNPQYFDAFFKHAKTEFNVENLSFWKDVHTLVSDGKTKKRSLSNSKRFLLKSSLSTSTPAGATTAGDSEAGSDTETINTASIMSHKEAALAIYNKYVIDGSMLQVIRFVIVLLVERHLGRLTSPIKSPPRSTKTSLF